MYISKILGNYIGKTNDSLNILEYFDLHLMEHLKYHNYLIHRIGAAFLAFFDDIKILALLPYVRRLD